MGWFSVVVKKEADSFKIQSVQNPILPSFTFRVKSNFMIHGQK